MSASRQQTRSARVSDNLDSPALRPAAAASELPILRSGIATPPDDTPGRRVCDYIAGFTDRFAIKRFRELYVDPVLDELPKEWDV